MKLLDRVSNPHELRRLSREELPQLADELRDEIVAAVSETGGHFSSNLGTVELTIALHYLFDTPRDLLVWDVGHQTYPHKILTGRREAMKNLRTLGGISGGPYLLAKAGLIDRHRVTLHWEHQPAFREAFPEIAVAPSLFEIDGRRITCSGGISSLDMMAALIESCPQPAHSVEILPS